MDQPTQALPRRDRLKALESKRGRPKATPLHSSRPSGYGVTVSVWTTWVVPGVTFEVMLATD
jgi:hypothetical protein